MRLTYDPEADVLYVRLRDVPVVDTTPVVADGLEIASNAAVDLDGNNDVVGFEITSASTLAGLDPGAISLTLLTRGTDLTGEARRAAE